MGIFNKKKEERQFFPYITKAFDNGVFNAEYNLAVDQSVSLIANTISTLPINAYLHTKSGKKLAYWLPVYQLLKDPAVEESAQLFYKTIIRHILLKGNAYIFKHKSHGEVVSLEIVAPQAVTVNRDPVTGRKLFNIVGGQRGGLFTENEIIHICYTGEGYTGTQGKSPAEVHRADINRNDIIAEYINVFFKNGIGSRLLVELGEKYEPGSPKMEKLMQEFKAYFNTFVLGPSNANAPIITVPGTKISKIEQSSNAQADVLNLYRESCRDIYRIFNVPPEVLDSSASKYNSLEQKNIDFLITCIRPLCVHIAQVLAKSLLKPEEQGIIFFDYDYTSLLETDINTKITYYRSALQAGIMNLAEVRTALNLSIPEDEVVANTFMVPSNLMPWDRSTIEASMAKSKLALQQMQEDSNADNGFMNEQDKDNMTKAEENENKNLNHNGTALDRLN